MKRRKAIRLVLQELRRAKQLFPDWPVDYVHQAGIVAEEAGEAMKAALEQPDEIPM